MQKLALAAAFCASLSTSGALHAATPYTDSMDANRNRLFADWAARHGQSNLCQAWEI
jgi:hypothetical protein